MASKDASITKNQAAAMAATLASVCGKFHSLVLLSTSVAKRMYIARVVLLMTFN